MRCRPAIYARRRADIAPDSPTNVHRSCGADQVANPERLLHEARRCVRSGGLLTVFEPDWTTMRVVSDYFDEDARWFANVRHPDAGANLPDMVESADSRIVDIVEEQSVWHTLARARVGINVEAALARRVEESSMNDADAAAWLDEQRRRDTDGVFRATMTKRLVVAHME
jgi:hypothetical protein